MNSTLERLRQRRDAGEGGFTLIELLIVIVVLGILAAIVVFAVQNLTGTSAQASCRTDYKSVETATEAYKAQNASYPASVANLVPTYLRDAPINGSHYAIATNGGVVTVDTVTAAGADSGTAVGATGSIDACSSVN